MFNTIINAKNLEELKKEYRRLALRFHPDMEHGSEEKFVALTEIYDKIFIKLQSKTKNEDEKTEVSSKYKDIINSLIKYNLTIEIVGTWIWVSGQTYEAKDTLKELGFKWASKKKMWYYSPTKNYQKKSKRNLSINEIKSIYGSQKVSTVQPRLK